MAQTKTQIWTALGVVVGAMALMVSVTQCAERHLEAVNVAARNELEVKLGSKLDTSRYARDRVADSAFKADIRDLILDALCAKSVDPTNRKCSARNP